MRPPRDQGGTRSGPSRHQVEILRKSLSAQPITELMAVAGRKDRTKFRNQVLRPLVEAGWIKMTIPDKADEQEAAVSDHGGREGRTGGGGEGRGDGPIPCAGGVRRGGGAYGEVDQRRKRMSNEGGGGWSTPGSCHSTQLLMRAYRFDRSPRGEHPRRWWTGTVSGQGILGT